MSFERNATLAERKLRLALCSVSWTRELRVAAFEWKDEIAARQPAAPLTRLAEKHEAQRRHTEWLLAEYARDARARSISHWGMFSDAT